MQLDAETIGTLTFITALCGGVARWLIAAWQKALVDQRTSPSSTAVIVDASVDVVDVLRKQLATMATEVNRLQVELEKVRALLTEVERQRDEWRERAVSLGWRSAP